MEAKDLNEVRIYVGTYAKYNNGSLQGEWVELSDFYDLDDFMERCAEIHEDEEEPEYMFQAWEEVPDGLIDEGHLEETFFELRDELDRLNDKEKEAFCIWADGNSSQLTQDAYSLVKSFQPDYRGSYASREDFAEELVKMVLLSAKLQNDRIFLSATPINRRCGFLFGKVSPSFRLSFIGCPLKRENGRHEMWPNVYF